MGFIKLIERERERKKARKEILAAVAVNQAIRAKGDKIRAESWKLIREIEPIGYKQV